MLSGAITAIVTPFRDDDSIDYDSLARLIEWQVAGSVTGIVVAGTTGESNLLSLAEKLELIKTVIKLVNGRTKIIVGVSQIGTLDAKSYVEQHLNIIAGIDYILVSVPYYVKPTQEGMYIHFEQVAQISKMPVIMYNVPSRSGTNLEDDTAILLAKNCHNIIGLKDATGDLTRCAYLVKNMPCGFRLFSGDDITAMEFMFLGGNGVISVVSNIVPKQISKLCLLSQASDVNSKEYAKKINRKLQKLIELLFIEANPIPVKWALYFAKIIAACNLRLPLTTLTFKAQQILCPIVQTSLENENQTYEN